MNQHLTLGLAIAATFGLILAAFLPSYADKDYFCTLTVMGDCLDEQDDFIRIQDMNIYSASLKDNQTMQVDVILRNVVIKTAYDVYFICQVSDEQGRTAYLYTQPNLTIGDGQAESMTFNLTLDEGVYSTKVFVWQKLAPDTYYPLLLHPKEQVMTIEKNTR